MCTLAFFSRTPAVARMRILEGRRRRVEERREGLREMLGRTGRADDRYSRQLHELSLESSEREVRWLNELIAAEASDADETLTKTTTGARKASTSRKKKSRPWVSPIRFVAIVGVGNCASSLVPGSRVLPRRG